MSLRRPPTRSAAFLAANRSNALKSTGPRTASGKARVALNSVRQGRRAFHLRQNLLAAGAREQVAFYDWVLDAICRCYDIPRERDGRPRYGTPEYARQVEGLARGIFVGYRRALEGWRQAKPQSPFDARVFANALRFRIRIRNAERTRRLAFWLQPGRGPNYLSQRVALPQPALPLDPLEYVAAVGARLGTPLHAHLWAGCRVLPPTPRVMIYRRVAPPSGRARGGERSAPTTLLVPSRAPGRVDYHSHCYPGGGGAPSSQRPRQPRRESDKFPSSPRRGPRGGGEQETRNQPVASRPLTNEGRARGPIRMHAFFPGWSPKDGGAREDAQRPPASAPVRRFFSGIVGALSGWVRKFPTSLRRGSKGGGET